MNLILAILDLVSHAYRFGQPVLPRHTMRDRETPSTTLSEVLAHELARMGMAGDDAEWTADILSSLSVDIDQIEFHRSIDDQQSLRFLFDVLRGDAPNYLDVGARLALLVRT